MDDLIAKQKWDCPISECTSNEAYYSFKTNHIVLPLRSQFSKLNDFYATALHEMAHSTIHPDSLNRKKNVPEGIDTYGHEELIAELTSGLTACVMKIEKTPSEDNAAYIQGWLSNIKQDKCYVFNCLNDAKSTSKYICERIGVDLKESLSQEIDDINVPEEISVKNKKKQTL